MAFVLNIFKCHLFKRSVGVHTCWTFLNYYLQTSQDVNNKQRVLICMCVARKNSSLRLYACLLRVYNIIIAGIYSKGNWTQTHFAFKNLRDVYTLENVHWVTTQFGWQKPIGLSLGVIYIPAKKSTEANHYCTKYRFGNSDDIGFSR